LVLLDGQEMTNCQVNTVKLQYTGCDWHSKPGSGNWTASLKVKRAKSFQSATKNQL